MKQFFFFASAIAITFASCTSSENKTNNEVAQSSTDITAMATEEVDLTNYGFLLNMDVPKGATIEKDKLDFIYIKKDNFELMGSPLGNTEDGFTVASQVSETKSDDRSSFDGFKVVKEDANGYIYKFDGINGDEYGFSYFIEKNGEIYSFMNNGLSLKSFTQAEAEAMYNACKNAK